MRVEVHVLARPELAALPLAERLAMDNAIGKLHAAGTTLGYPHTSQGERIRELRPRAGRSPWRAFYRRIRDTLVIGPEARVDPRGFRAAVAAAVERLDAYEQEVSG